MEAEKSLAQSERLNKEKVEFESAIYIKVNALTCLTCFFAVTLLLLLFFYSNHVVQHWEDVLVVRNRLPSSCLTINKILITIL